MQLKSILKDIEYTCVLGDEGVEIKDIVYDSRNDLKGSVFVCLEGSSLDGHDFAKKAIENGAVALVVSKEVKVSGACVILVKDTREVLALMSRNFFKNPSLELKTIAITGTKGKTTVSFMLQSIIENAGYKVGVIGTVGVLIGEKTIKTKNTTPESYEVQKYLRMMVDSGCEYAILEASSLGLKHHRLDGIEFDCGAFTNFSKDHICEGEHADLAEYLECKGILFKHCKVGSINIDELDHKLLLKGHTCDIKTYGVKNFADFTATNKKLIFDTEKLGVSFNLNLQGNFKFPVEVSIPGEFTVYNALCAIAVCFQFNINQESILKGLSTLKVKGRVEIVPTGKKFTLIIDYAHNAISMENILNTLREYRPTRLIVMFGAGGNRPKIRRYEMGEVAGRLADFCVITEDNSRFESPGQIMADIETGLCKNFCQYIVVPCRREAIKFCISNAKEGDIIVLAGKGHEDYQEINGEKYHFDEREIIFDIINSEIKI